MLAVAPLIVYVLILHEYICKRKLSVCILK